MEIPAFDGVEVQSAPVERVKVEMDDFTNAVKGDRYNCALVWAIRRKHPEARRVQVDTSHVGFSIGETRYVYPTSPEIIERVIRPLDTGGEVKPCTVKLSDGYTKPVQHKDEDGLQKKNNQQRKSVAEKKQRGESLAPASARYRRLTVMVTEE